MKKVKNNALNTGAERNGYYCCPDCGKQNKLSAKRCVFCRAKRPTDACQQTLEMQQPSQASYSGFADRTVRNAFPTPPNPCFAVPLPPNGVANGNYINNTLANVPDYYSTDEYGRVFKANVTYGALPCSAPVPVPMPSKIIQFSSINIPINTNYTNN